MVLDGNNDPNLQSDRTAFVDVEEGDLRAPALQPADLCTSTSTDVDGMQLTGIMDRRPQKNAEKKTERRVALELGLVHVDHRPEMSRR